MEKFKSLEEINLDVDKFYTENGYNDNWKLNYHFEPPFGLINDPNGLSYYNGEYYLFFQWNPYTCEHKYKHWGLVKTKNFIDYTMPKVVLAPTDWYDKDGCYSGSALEVEGKLELIYTGNVKDSKGNRESYQVRARYDDNGSITKIGPIISDIPKGARHRPRAARRPPGRSWRYAQCLAVAGCRARSGTSSRAPLRLIHRRR